MATLNYRKLSGRVLNQACVLIVALLGLALLSGATARAQSIVGNVSTTFGVPVPGVLVTGTRSLPFQRVTTSTDASGNYTLGSGLGGTYSVVPSKSGYAFTPASTNVAVKSGGANGTANFTTPATVPSATTQPAQNVTATSATLNGLVNPDGAATSAHFEYGLTTSYGSVSSSTFLGSGTASVPVSIAVGSLLNGMNYHFRVVAGTSFGVSLGRDLNFATLSGIPSVTTLDPTASDATSMRLNGSVNPNGDSASAWFEWGATTGYGNATATKSLGSGSDQTNFSQALTGLAAGTTYHCRAVAATSFGTNYGADVLFTPVFTNITAGLPGVSYSLAAWGDYDYDGRLDILLTGTINGTFSGAIAQVWRNTGSGFVNIGAGLPGVAFGSVARGDYDNDGRLDILLTGDDVNAKPFAQVWRNTGSGFTNINAGLPGVDQGSVAWGDYDNDGRLDILMTGTTNRDLSGAIAQVWRNTGNGFSNINAGLPGVEFGSVAWGDFDNDGRLDILLTGYSDSGPIAQVWRNTGSGFTNINAGLPGVLSSSVAWGDYDNDGRLDILLTGDDVNQNPIAQVWRNTGSGFVNIGAGLPGVDHGSVAWGDYDNDGRLDILLTGFTGSSAISQVWRNTGSSFVNINAGLPGVYEGSVAWGDYDNDGRLDILLAGYSPTSGYIAQVWRNVQPAANSVPAGPTGLAAAASGTVVTLNWNPATDGQTPAPGLTYNLRVGSAPGGSDLLSPMAASDGYRRLPQMGNAQERLTALFPVQLGQTYYWSVQAVDSAFAGSPFAGEQHFTVNTVLTPPNGIPVPGDLNGDGVVDQSELNTVLSNYWPYSPWLFMTNTAGLAGTNVQFALTNASAWDFSVLVSTNLMDWDFLGPAFPVYQFIDPAATNAPMRYYRLRWP